MLLPPRSCSLPVVSKNNSRQYPCPRVPDDTMWCRYGCCSCMHSTCSEPMMLQQSHFVCQEYCNRSPLSGNLPPSGSAGPSFWCRSPPPGTAAPASFLKHGEYEVKVIGKSSSFTI